MPTRPTPRRTARRPLHPAPRRVPRPTTPQGTRRPLVEGARLVAGAVVREVIRWLIDRELGGE